MLFTLPHNVMPDECIQMAEELKLLRLCILKHNLKSFFTLCLHIFYVTVLRSAGCQNVSKHLRMNELLLLLHQHVAQARKHALCMYY